MYNNERPLPIEKLFDLDESVLYLLAYNNVCVYLYFIVLSTHNMDFVVRLDAIFVHWKYIIMFKDLNGYNLYGLYPELNKA